MAASAVGPPGVRTPGSGRVEHDLHPTAPPPRLHELVDREPRASVGVAPRPGVPALRGWLGRLRYHTANTRGTEASTAPVPQRRHHMVPPWVIPTQWPPGALCLVALPLNREHPALGGAGPGPRGSGTSAADREGTLVPEGRQQGGDWESRAPSLQWRRGDRQGAAARPYRQSRASWSVGPDTARPWVTCCRVDSPHLGSAPVSVQWRKHPMRMSPG